MKQVIVMVAMVALGLAIAGIVIGFEEAASDLAGAVNDQITYEGLIGN